MTHMLYPIYFVIFIIQLTTCATVRKSRDANEKLTRNQEIEEINSLIVDHVISQANKPITFQLQKPCTPFIGRVSELSELKWSQADHKYVVLSGPRGIGKTELAKKYSLDFKHDNTSNIIWIDAESHETLITAFKDLAVIIGVTIENKSVTSILRETFSYFNKRKTLFIFDKASDDNIIINNLKVFIGNSKSIHVILTSRDENWGKDFKIIKLNVFSKENCVDYIKYVLKQGTNLVIDEKSSEKLSELLKFLPLALNKATEYIIKRNTLSVQGDYTIDDYIKQLLRNELPVETTTTPPLPPSDTEIEESLADKIKQEGKRIGDQIGDVASDAWEKISDESSRFGDRVGAEASRTGNRISEEAARIESQIKDFFSFG